MYMYVQQRIHGNVQLSAHSKPQQGQLGRWKGDFRLKDIEDIIKDNNLLNLEIEQIVQQ